MTADEARKLVDKAVKQPKIDKQLYTNPREKDVRSLASHMNLTKFFF